VQSIAKVVPVADPSYDPRVLDDLDEDVIAERQRTAAFPVGNAMIPNEIIVNNQAIEDGYADSLVKPAPLVVNHLRKIFPPTVAGRPPVLLYFFK
jgi:hypothetical protein